MNRLPSEAVPATRQFLERITNQLSDLEEKQAKRKANNQAAKRSRQRRLDVIEMIACFIHNGMNHMAALQAVAVATGIDLDQLRPALKKALLLAETKSRQIRNREIMQRVARGWTNAEIGRHCGMHEKSIARIVTQIKKNGI